MTNATQQAYQRSLRWYVPITCAVFIVSYLTFFPVGQLPWMFWLRTAMEVIYAIATIFFCVAAVRFIKTRKQNGP